jgi:hypothetical protein
MTEPAVIYIDCHCEADPDIPYDVAALCAGAQPGIFRAFVPPDALTFFAIDQLILFVARRILADGVRISGENYPYISIS